MTKKNKTVTISLEEYEQLLDADLKLSCLESMGVDNWCGYYEAIDMYREEKDSEE